MNALTHHSWPWPKLTARIVSNVNWLGFSGETDWHLMPRIIEGDFFLVTKNGRDFRKLCGYRPCNRCVGIGLKHPDAAQQSHGP
jgi:hypothetical protein